MQKEGDKQIEDFNDMQNQDLENNLSRKISELSDLHLRYTYSNASSTSEFGLYEQASTSQQFEQKFVKDEEIFSDILVKLAEVKATLFIENDDLCLYVFEHYHWSMQKMISYFTEDWALFKEHSQYYDPMSTFSNVSFGICSVCCDQTSIYSSGMCHHKYCQPCWKFYIKNELQAGRIFFNCMNEKPCEQAPVLKGFVKMIAPELRQLYRKKICVNYCIQNKDISYCPNQKCPYFCSKPSLMELALVKCPCGELYCFKCQSEPHVPATCKDVQRWNEILNSQNLNLTWIKNNTRECPKCKQPIEKKVGCSHMKCICQCQFCYECNKAWDAEHVGMKSECPNRKKLKMKGKLSDRVIELEEELTSMMKEVEKHAKQLKECQTLVKEETLLNKVIEVKVEVICAWMTLKWTKILLTLQNRPHIVRDFQQDFVGSIRSTMEPVQFIIKNVNSMAVRDLHHYGEMVLVRKQILKKNKNVWLEAFQENSPNAKCLSFSI